MGRTEGDPVVELKLTWLSGNTDISPDSWEVVY